MPFPFRTLCTSSKSVDWQVFNSQGYGNSDG